MLIYIFHDKMTREEIYKKPPNILGGENDIMETLSPKYRRPMCSVFEYSRLLTILARTIFHSPSLAEYMDNGESISNMVNYCELAYQLIKTGKWDAKLDNGYDPVSLSRLKINPRWNDMIEVYINELNQSRNEELFSNN